MLALVVGGTWFALESGRRKEAFAGRALQQARAAAEAGNLPLAASELQRLVDTYGGTKAAQEAVITLNQVRMVNGQSELAVVNLREFLGRGPAREFVAPASGLLGAALENSKRPQEAGAAYEAASKAADVDYLKAQYLVQAARAYVAAGMTAEAIRTLQIVGKDFPDTPAFSESQVRLAELTKGTMGES